MKITDLKSSGFSVSARFKQPSYHFLVLWGLVLMHMFNWAEPYRVFINMNLIIVIVYGISHIMRNESIPYKKCLVVLAIPLGFIALHMLAVGRFEFVKEMRLLILATSLTLGIWMLAARNMAYVKRHMLTFAVTLIVIYLLIQAVALFILHKPYGTTKNPHYLAQYSILCIPIAIYCFIGATVRLKYLLAFCILALGGFTLSTSSRPAWIALIVSALLVLFFLDKEKRKLAAFLIVAIPLVLFLTNIANFRDRFTDLAENISKEERVVIWQDAWKMQKTSTDAQWLYGHGLDSFLENFKPYSRYHLQNIDYNAPHNYFLELLYTSGVLGVCLFIGMYYLLYSYLVMSMRSSPEYKSLNSLLIVMLTMHLLFIMITIPFFRSYNLNIVALIGGAALFARAMATNPKL